MLDDDGRSSRRTTAAGAILIAGAFAIVLAGADSEVFDLERHLIPKNLVLHATALALLAIGVPSWRGVRWGAPTLLLSLFVAWSAVATVFAENRWLAFQAWGISFSSFVLFLAARRVGRTRRWGVIAGILAAAVTGAAIGVAQAYGADWAWLAESRAPGGTFGNRNFLAHLSAIALGPLVLVAARSRGRWLPLPLLGLAVLVAAIVLTRSRAAWLGSAAGLLATVFALAILSRRRLDPRPWGRIALAGAFVCAAVAAAVILPNRLQWSTSAPYAQTLERLGDYRAGSGAGRLAQYRTSLRLVPIRPVLGVGPGNWFVQYPRVTGPGDPSWSSHLTIPTNPWPSSDWMAMVTERGAVGALLLLLAGVSATLAALGWRAPPGSGEGERDTRDTHQAAAMHTGADVRAGDGTRAGAVVVGALAAALVAGAFDAVLILAAPSFFVWTLVGLTLPRTRPRVAFRPDRTTRLLAGGSAVIVVVALLVVTAGSTAALVATRMDRGTAAVARAARLAPWEHRLQLLLAERGRCDNARKAAALMPHHESARGLERRCGG